MQCNQPTAQERCESLATQLHQQSRFALGVTHLPQQMTSNMELKIQCGGLNGLKHCISNEPATVTDIYSLVDHAVLEFGSIEQLPYSRIAQSINQWQPKRRNRRRRD